MLTKGFIPFPILHLQAKDMHFQVKDMHLHPEDVYLQAIDKENVRPSAYQQPAFLIQPAGKKDGNRPAGMHMTPEKH